MQAQRKEPPKVLGRVDFGSYLLEETTQAADAGPKSEEIIKAVSAFNSAFEDSARRDYESSVVRELKRLLGKDKKKKQKKKGKQR